MHTTLQFARRAALAGAALAAVVLVAGCDLTTAPLDGSGGGTQADPVVLAGITAALDTTDFTASLSIDSDTGEDAWAAFAPGSAGAELTHERANFRREVTSSTRHYEITALGDTATVLLTEDRTGVFHVRADSVTTLDRPFTDHAERSVRAVWVAGVRPGHDSTETGGDSTSTGRHDNGQRSSHWRVLSSTVLNRWSTSVESPVQILSVELKPENEPAVRVEDPTLLVSADQWPRFPSGRTTSVTVRVANATAGTQVLLHDRFEKSGRRIGLVPDSADPTIFRGTWRPSSSGDGERDWRRMLTVDVADGTTLSADVGAAYNARQWVIPVAFTRPRRL